MKPRSVKTIRPTPKALYRGTWHAQYICDGAKNLNEVIIGIQIQLHYLRKLKRAGVKLIGEVYDDTAHLVTDNESVARELGFEEEAEEGIGF